MDGWALSTRALLCKPGCLQKLLSLHTGLRSGPALLLLLLHCFEWGHWACLQQQDQWCIKSGHVLGYHKLGATRAVLPGHFNLYGSSSLRPSHIRSQPSLPRLMAVMIMTYFLGVLRCELIRATFSKATTTTHVLEKLAKASRLAAGQSRIQW